MIGIRLIGRSAIVLAALSCVGLRSLSAEDGAASADAKGANEAKATNDAKAADAKAPDVKAADAKPAEAEASRAEHHFGAPERVAGPEEFKSDLAIWTFVVFLVLLAILGKFAWRPIIAGLQKREQGIADNIAAAQRTHEDAKLLLAEYDKKLAGAADQVRVMLDEARREAEQAKVEIIAEAKEAAMQEAERGRREVRLARDQALKDLSERAGDLAVSLAGKIIRAQLSPQDHAGLVREAMTEFVQAGTSAN